MEREGMAALMRGLCEAGLTVLDSSQKYDKGIGRDPANYQGPQVKNFSTQSCQMVVDHDTQAVDGHYASTYQLMHCNLQPTSPPVQLSEFPRQRHNVLPGQPNFEIGGADGAFRTNIYTSNRETVSLSSARTREADPFVSSLRKYPLKKYPTAHVDKAQNLIHRAMAMQSKIGPSPRYHSASNTMVSVDVGPASWHHSGDDEVQARTCPTSERREPAARGSTPLPQYCGKTARTLLSEYVRTNYPFGWPVYPNRSNECAPLLSDPDVTAPNYRMANVSSQAGVKMVSREVATPRISARSVAVSPSMTSFSVYTEGECRVPSSDRLVQVNTCPAVTRYNCLNNVYTMCSVKELGRKLCNNTTLRKSKSEQQLIINVNNDVVGVGDTRVETVRYEVFKQIIDCHKQPVKDSTSPINKESQYIDKAPYNASECKLAGPPTECTKTVTMKSNYPLDKRIGSYLLTKSDLKRIELYEINRRISDSNTNLRNELQNLHHRANCSSSKFCKCTWLGNNLQCCDITGQSVHYNKKMMLLNRTKSMIILENRLKLLVKNVLEEYFDKYGIEVNVHLLQVLENDVFSILVTSLQLIKFNNDAYVKIKLEDILKGHLGKITNKQTANITYVLLQSARNILNVKYLQNRYYTVSYLYTEKDIKLPFASDTLTRQKLIPLVMEHIDDWLKDLKISPNVEKETKRKMIKDLADDIVDRYLYLKLNPPCRPTYDEEIEYLKFQIYKWIRRLLGDDTKKILLRAQELMDRIRNTSDPVLKIVSSTSQSSTDEIDLAEQGGTLKPYLKINNAIPSESRRKWQIPSCSKQLFRQNSICNLPPFVKETPILRSSYDGNFIAAHTDCCKNNTISLPFSTGPLDYPSNDPSNFNPTVQQLNEDYDYYLKQWVQEIPIIAHTPKEQELADIARLGIYNGIWKAITKLSLDPKVFNNYFYCQDLLEIEIDDLLSNLPETEQLKNNKDRLKSQLLEKTVIMIDRIKNVVASSSFKQRLLENLDHNLPRASRFEPHLAEKEELLKVALVEDYILFIYFENDDAKSYIYKKKYLRKINELADYLKRNHINQFKHIDTKGHDYELICTMSKVPIPNDKIIQKETLEILLGQEIDHWLSDLPMKTNVRPLQKLQFRDITAKKIYEILKHTGWVDDVTHVELHKFLPKDMQKLPLEDGVNISFLIEELANRLKAFPKIASRRKAVSFEMSSAYTEFSRDVPVCSSYIDHAPLYGDISNITVKGKIVRDTNPQVSRGLKRVTMNGSEWISMDETKTPAGLINWPCESAQTSGSHKIQGTTFECRDTSCSSKKLPQQTPIHTDHANTNTQIRASTTQFKPSIPDNVNQNTAMPGRSFSLGDLKRPHMNSKDQFPGQDDKNKSPSLSYTNGRKRNDGPCQCMKRFIYPGPMIWFYDISSNCMRPMGIFPCFH